MPIVGTFVSLSFPTSTLNPVTMQKLW